VCNRLLEYLLVAKIPSPTFLGIHLFPDYQHYTELEYLKNCLARMGPTKENEAAKVAEARPRRGSVPDLKSSEKNSEKKVPTGPRANPLYKTRLCMNFQSTGSCPYTEKCQFAHGVKELEKWESWRNSHKGDELKKDEGDSVEGSRSRSHSLDKSSRTTSSDSHDLHDFGFDLGSPHSLNWEISTPVKGSSLLDENTPLSCMPDFSLWSSILDEIEDRTNTNPSGNRSRAATYDNMSQLSDAPTLFPLPPVLPTFGNKTSFPR